MDTNKEVILKAINDFYGNDGYCEEMEEEFNSLAEFIANRLKEEE